MTVCVVTGLAGCASSTPAHPTHDVLRTGDLPESSPGQPVTPEVLTAKDRCPATLHDIEGALLEYYVDHRDLPAKLEDLRPYAPNLSLNCPDTGLPYAYSAQGLRKPGGTRRIIVYDQVRNPDGTRWCIMIADGKPGQAQRTEVIQLPEPLFLAYQ